MNKRALVCFGMLLVLSWSLGGADREPRPRDLTAHLIGHAHIDLAWLWNWEETVHDIAVQTFKGTLAQMAKMPGLTFAQSQAAVYEAIEKNAPALFAAIREKVAAGTWIPVGGMWAEPDLNMPDGEALVRQLLYGKRYFAERFGVDVKVGWNPDSFGHNAQLPQVLKKSGIDYYVFERCAPERTPFFWWQGPDGSRVLSYVPPGWYLVNLRDGVRKLLLDASKTTPVRDFMLLYGEGDHGGGPRGTDVLAILKYRKDKGHPRLAFTVPEEYFRKVASAGADFPVIQRELNFTFPACYTTQAQTKKNNRKTESLLLTAERFAGLAAFAGFRDYYPERDIDESWKIALRNQFHDILDGSSIGTVYDEAEQHYKEAFARGRRALDFSLEAITDSINTAGDGIPLVVFNPLFWDRTDVLEMDVAMPAADIPKEVRIVDPDGTEVPVQVLGATKNGDTDVLRVLFVAPSVPSFGYKVFRALSAEQAAAATGTLSVTSTSLENEFFRLSFDPATGWLRGLVDKQTGREVLDAEGHYLEAISDEPESMSAWELGLKERIGRIGENGASLEVLENGPVRVALRVKSRFRRSLFTQDFMLYRGVPRVDCRMTIDWQERRVMVKAAFPVSVRNANAEFEIPFGSVSREANGQEVPAQRWIDLTDESGTYGVSLLNDCKYGFDVRSNVLRMSVVHGATSPDPEADRGPHELVYSLYPHQGNWQSAGTLRRGLELNMPFLGHAAMAHAGAQPGRRAFIRVSPDNVVLSALKKESGYYNRGLVLRVFESFGQRTEVNIELPWAVSAFETDLIERPLKPLPVREGGLTFALGPYEIKTIKLVMKPKA